MPEELCLLALMELWEIHESCRVFDQARPGSVLGHIRIESRLLLLPFLVHYIPVTYSHGYVPFKIIIWQNTLFAHLLKLQMFLIVHKSLCFLLFDYFFVSRVSLYGTALFIGANWWSSIAQNKPIKRWCWKLMFILRSIILLTVAKCECRFGSVRAGGCRGAVACPEAHSTSLWHA